MVIHMNAVREEDLKYIISRISYKQCEGKTFLVTGANGFLASYMVDTLMYLNLHYLEKKCKVIALCRNRKKAEVRFKEWLFCENFLLYVQNVEKPVADSLEADYVVHAASSSATSDFNKIPADVLKTNILGTYHLLEFAKNKKAQGFLFFSSGAAYGNVSAGLSNVKETDLFLLDFNAAENCYAEGKRSGEALCRAYYCQYGVPARIVRIGHTYGPGIDLNDGHVYSDFAARIIRNENLPVKNADVVRPFCYVSDAVIAFFLILLEGENGEVYNMVNKKETVSIYELASKLAEKAFPEKGLKVECEKKESNVQKTTMSVDKLEALGWYPEIGITEGFKRTVRSFEEEVRYE